MNTCFQWRQQQARLCEEDLGERGEELPSNKLPVPDEIEEFEKEQLVREAVALLPPRYQELIQMLFYEQPPLPYREAAARLGLATGSIGLMRCRCLRRLEQILKDLGLEKPLA